MIHKFNILVIAISRRSRYSSKLVSSNQYNIRTPWKYEVTPYYSSFSTEYQRVCISFSTLESDGLFSILTSRYRCDFQSILIIKVYIPCLVFYTPIISFAEYNFRAWMSFCRRNFLPLIFRPCMTFFSFPSFLFYHSYYF